MTPIEIANVVVVVVGVPAILAAFVYIGRKLEVLDSVQKLTQDLSTSLANLRERFIVVETRVKSSLKDEVAPANSPRQLNEMGKHILLQSGVKEIVDELRIELAEKVKKRAPQNAYDAEGCILKTVEDIPLDHPELLDRLKQGSFQSGRDLGIVLLVGGFYLRDLIFSELGFELKDVDIALPREI